MRWMSRYDLPGNSVPIALFVGTRFTYCLSDICGVDADCHKDHEWTRSLISVQMTRYSSSGTLNKHAATIR
ncbi:hypothetical protein HYPSUDRAFT_41435 [Hypholoma sublateritium FD-334 SS-4]|uniref:Uncharacterized protein n=1 Tax=Hypholoma sublateritium (strain FD-334 SS-4) TaxID=945553 RepID=A0A0D2NZX8_HYPSF|nr:hypothetical protein HYPSUDRAFT_41435 [Hypholoma sublateritium FD-334 SS-4]